MNLHKQLLLAICGFYCFLLQACSFYGDFYIVNASSFPVTATIKFTTPVQELLSSSEELALRYANRVLEVDDNTSRLLKIDLSYVLIDSQTLSIRIPPNSTALIGGTVNRPIAADSFRFETNGKQFEYSLRSISKDLKKTGGIMPPFHFTYIVTKENLTAYVLHGRTD